MPIPDEGLREQAKNNNKLLKDMTRKKIHYLLTKHSIKDVDVYAVIKEFFKEYLQANYEFTFEELTEELKKIYIEKDIKDRLFALLERFRTVEYSDQEIPQDILKSILMEFDNLLNDLIKKGEATGFLGRFFGPKPAPKPKGASSLQHQQPPELVVQEPKSAPEPEPQVAPEPAPIVSSDPTPNPMVESEPVPQVAPEPALIVSSDPTPNPDFKPEPTPEPLISADEPSKIKSTNDAIEEFSWGNEAPPPPADAPSILDIELPEMPLAPESEPVSQVAPEPTPEPIVKEEPPAPNIEDVEPEPAPEPQLETPPAPDVQDENPIESIPQEAPPAEDTKDFDLGSLAEQLDEVIKDDEITTLTTPEDMGELIGDVTRLLHNGNIEQAKTGYREVVGRYDELPEEDKHQYYDQLQSLYQLLQQS